MTPEQRRRYNQAYRAKHLTELRAKDDVRRHGDKVQRYCEECGAPFDLRARPNKRYCSRKCINTVSLRERLAERNRSHQGRRARLRGAEMLIVTDRDWQRLQARHGHRCAYCGIAAKLTKDHVVPLQRGGRHSIGNILPACRSCNSSKRDKFLVVFKVWRNR